MNFEMAPERRKLWLAIGAVALGQAAVLGWMIWDRASLLANGREVVLEVIPVDPRSLFRGDYVVLGYDISRFDLPAGAPTPERNAPYYVTLKKTDGPNWHAVGGSVEKPADVKPDEVVIKGRVDWIGRQQPDKLQDAGRRQSALRHRELLRARRDGARIGKDGRRKEDLRRHRHRRGRQPGNQGADVGRTAHLRGIAVLTEVSRIGRAVTCLPRSLEFL